MADRERVTSDSRRWLPRVKVDVVVMVVLVVTILGFAPGHGVSGWVLGLVAVISVGVAVGVLGRRYPWIHGQPRRCLAPVLPYLTEELCAHSAPVRELVMSIPTPGCDHRQHQ